jgi:hypothetical protein
LIAEALSLSLLDLSRQTHKRLVGSILGDNEGNGGNLNWPVQRGLVHFASLFTSKFSINLDRLILGSSFSSSFDFDANKLLELSFSSSSFDFHADNYLKYLSGCHRYLTLWSTCLGQIN